MSHADKARRAIEKTYECLNKAVLRNDLKEAEALLDLELDPKRIQADFTSSSDMASLFLNASFWYDRVEEWESFAQEIFVDSATSVEVAQLISDDATEFLAMVLKGTMQDVVESAEAEHGRGEISAEELARVKAKQLLVAGEVAHG